MRNIIAGHHGERRNACRAPALQPGEDQAENRARIIRLGGIRKDRRMRGIEPARRGVDEIAPFRDRQRDDADRRIGKPRDQAGPVLRREIVDHHTRDARRRAAGILLNDGREPILPRKALAHGGVMRCDPSPNDREITAEALVEQVIQIHRHMGAVEIADTDMEDARR